jgi:hypothetical protein
VGNHLFSFNRIEIGHDDYALAVPKGLPLAGVQNPDEDLDADARRVLNRCIQFHFGNQHTQRTEEWYRRALPRHEIVAQCRTYEVALAIPDIEAVPAGLQLQDLGVDDVDDVDAAVGTLRHIIAGGVLAGQGSTAFRRPALQVERLEPAALGIARARSAPCTPAGSGLGAAHGTGSFCTRAEVPKADAALRPRLICLASPERVAA